MSTLQWLFNVGMLVWVTMLEREIKDLRGKK